VLTCPSSSLEIIILPKEANRVEEPQVKKIGETKEIFQRKKSVLKGFQSWLESGVHLRLECSVKFYLPCLVEMRWSLEETM